MSSKIIKNIKPVSFLSGFRFSLTLLVFMLLCFYNDAHSKESALASLQLDPEQCAALHKGQSCYVKVDVTWQAKNVGDYCLFLASENKAMACWQGENQGEFEYNFSHNDSRTFQLKTRQGGIILAEAELEIAWVYKSKRVNSSWRMF